MLILDVWKIIFELLDFKSKINFISTCHYFRDNLIITDLYNIEQKYLELLSDEVLHYKIFSKVKTLNATDNKKITSVSFMKSLKILYAEDNCGIDQNGIDCLDLVELYADSNTKITNVSFMKSLKVLSARYSCGIDQNGIEGLNLDKLYMILNEKIKIYLL